MFVNTKLFKSQITFELQYLQHSISVSGFSGKWPNCESINEFVQNLYNQIDMLHEDDTRWPFFHNEIPRRMGIIQNMEKFDASYFDIIDEHADRMDPQCRLLLELAYEAVYDAGVNPRKLRGSKTGVFIACQSDMGETSAYERSANSDFGCTAYSRSMLANRISYAMDLTGPSCLIDTACSGFLCAFENAFRAIKYGHCDAALVGGVNALLHPHVTLQFSRLGALSPQGFCRVFDSKASGYVRSEGVCMFFVQRSMDARRIYGTIVNAKSNCDGYKSEGITYPSSKMQKELFVSLYDECGVDPNSVPYVEAHGTGTMVGDPVECDALDNAFCLFRSEPLLVGSVKSNMGHSEAASGACSLVKTIITFENGIIPGNIHFNELRPEIASLMEGRLKVCDTPTAFTESLIGINSFGFGGSNTHALMRRHSKVKSNTVMPNDELPRLIVWCSRTEQGINHFFNQIESQPIDLEYYGLLHNIQCNDVDFNAKNRYRGYGIYKYSTGVKHAVSIENTKRICNEFEKPPIVWIFGSDMNIQCITPFMQIPIIQKYIEQYHKRFLQSTNINLMNIIKSIDNLTAAGVSDRNSKIISITIQLCMINLMRILGIDADYYIGFGYTEFLCAYADAQITAQQTIAVATAMDSFEQYKKSDLAKTTHIKADESKKWLNNKVPMKNGFKTSASKFYEDIIVSTVPKNSIIIEMCPNEVFHNLTTKLLPDSLYIPLIEHLDDDMYGENILFLFKAIGRIYLTGLNVPIYKMYPPVRFPVSRSTPMISSLVDWDHTKDWYISKFVPQTTSGYRIVKINASDQEYDFILCHQVDEIALFPGMAFITLVWETLAMMNGKSFSEMNIEFQDVRLVRATTVTIDQTLEFTIMIHAGTGRFEVTENATTVCKGMVKELKEPRDSKSIDKILEKFIENDLPIMNKTDYYKELNLRGYQYSGIFANVEKVRADGCYGQVKWYNNWIAHLDGILQVTMLEYKRRTLLLPTQIDGIKIYTDDHLKILSELDENKLLDVKYIPETLTLYAGAIELFGKRTNPTTRKRAPGFPILEKYQFVPYRPTMKMNFGEAVRICIQIILENRKLSNVKAIEIDLDDGEQSHQPFESIIEYVDNAINDIPLVTTELTLITKRKDIKLTKISIEHDMEQKPKNCTLIIGTNCCEYPKLFERYLKEHSGYVLSREMYNKHSNKEYVLGVGFQCISILPTNLNNEILVLFQSIKNEFKQKEEFTVQNEIIAYNVVHISDKLNRFDWLTELQEVIKIGPVIVLSYNQQNSGILGLVKCLLREPIEHAVICVLIDDQHAPPFDVKNNFYQSQLHLGLAINVYRNGQWGSYRHLRLTNNSKNVISMENSKYNYCYANIISKADVSTLNWNQSSITMMMTMMDDRMRRSSNNECLVNVYYAAINAYDLIVSDEFNGHRRQKEQINNTLGIEYSGKTASGKSVMGISFSGALATKVIATHYIWDVPVHWTLQDAATVPLSYLTVYAAFFHYNPISKGKSILIHNGSDGIGVAAIRIALAYGMNVFTTVMNVHRKTLLLEMFPKQLNENQIGFFQKCSYERLIKYETFGMGVDYVLNTLSGKHLHASVRCLRRGGTFLQIGIQDLKNDSAIQFMNDIIFYTITIDTIFDINLTSANHLIDLMAYDLQIERIQPLPCRVFPPNELENAYLCLNRDDYFGKILIEIVKSTSDHQQELMINYTTKILQRCDFDSELVYIVIGGLGGFGMEMTNWMIGRGAKKIVLCSRTGITKSYHSYRLSIWKSLGCTVRISTIDVTQRQGCKKLLVTIRNELGEIGGIFNLAMVLNDNIFENQTIETFMVSMAPKANTTTYIDELSRELCPALTYFVVFSSLACGCGNAGQSNYGTANAVMERIVENRVQCGLPGKAIQWGAIGEVGMVANLTDQNTFEDFRGYSQQRISSCLNELDTLLLCNEPIVVTKVIAEKRDECTGAKRTLIDSILKIMGIRDIKSIPITATLSDMGMDSLVAIEIKQTLEREYQLVFSTQDLRTLTFTRIKELTDEKDSAGDSIRLKLVQEVKPVNLKVSVNNLWDEKWDLNTVTRLQTRYNGDKFNSCVFIIPGIEGIASSQWHVMANYINLPTFMIQLTETIYEQTPENIVKILIDKIEHILEKIVYFYLVGYSFGTLPSFAFIRALKQRNLHGRIILVDGSPTFLKRICYGNAGTNRADDIKVLEKAILYYVINNVFPSENAEYIINKLGDCKNGMEKIQKLIEYGKTETKYSGKYVELMVPTFYNRLHMVASLDVDNFEKIENSITLVRPTEMSVTEITEDYDLSKFTDGEITIKFIDGNHVTMLENLELVQIINDITKN